MYLGPVVALIYPVALWSFHVSVVSAYETGGWATAALAAAVISLTLALQRCGCWHREAK
jgi:hypothetical protein